MDSKLFAAAPIRLLALLVGIGLCVWTINATARVGLSRIFERYSVAAGNVTAANKAIEMSPKNADAYRARAAVLSFSQAPAESAVEMERAVALRPADYSLWLDLGLFRDQIGDTSGALAAFDEAVRRAPFYAQPHWQRGNFLLRVGQYEAALRDLNQAAQSNPELVRNFVDLAWSLAHGDPKLVKQMIQVDSKAAHKTMAQFFASHGKPQEALVEFQAAGAVDDDTRLDLINNLLGKGSFAEAYQVWSAANGVNSSSEQSSRQFFDGGFESTLSFDQGGFGWRIPRRLQATTVSSDSSQPHSGSKNLRIEFSGDSNPGTDLVSQLVIVEPSRRYKISFAARSQDIVSGGLPIVTVMNVAADRKRLGQSPALSKGTSGWTVISFEFSTLENTKAVFISVQREGCTSSPCPIFGALSLDSFSIEQVK